MKEKIDWYQEVLDLEPGSKVFFPLAKLLAQNNEVLRAIDTLQLGLERHPEFIEARLYFIDLLHQNSDVENCKQILEQQLALLTPLFTRYAGFWKAWGNSAQITSQKGDTGLAIAFLAALFQDNSLSLSEIVAKGLQMVLGEDSKSTAGGSGSDGQAQSHAAAAPIMVKGVVRPDTLLKLQKKELDQPKDIENIDSDLSDDNLNAEHGISDISPTQTSLEEQKPTLDDDYMDEDEEREERFSLRTRSMAEVLAEQGDFAGALEIYEELVNNSDSAQEKEDLESRMNTLSSHLGTHQEKIVTEEVPRSPGKDRILSVLETLAERLENRANS